MPRVQRKHLLHEEETRSTILRTAQHLFMEHGYRAVSTRQIADACGLTQPALYHYFADKQDLYVAVMREDIAQTGAALERIARRSESVEERLKRVARYLLSTTQHDLALMQHDIRQELTPEAQSTLGEAFQEGLIVPIASIFNEGIQQGMLRDQQHGGMDVMTGAYMFMNMLSQFLTKSHSEQRFASFRRDMTESERAEIIVHILLHGLAIADKEQFST